MIVTQCVHKQHVLIMLSRKTFLQTCYVFFDRSHQQMVGVTEFVAYKGLLLPSFTRKDVLWPKE